mmetsp:Transcript_20652/g.62235  ORF Transcript_20652/g.62235 Transcript_20652/m.62235 type:complete len:143 (+) Transcript_20652:70-498(+)
MVRYKNRYLCFEIVWKDGRIDTSIGEADILQAITTSLQTNFGGYGVGTAGPALQVKYYHPIYSLLIVRCSTETHREVWCSCTCLTEIKGRVVTVRLLRLAGTVKSCKASATAFLQHLPQPKMTEQLRQMDKGALRKLELWTT